MSHQNNSTNWVIQGSNGQPQMIKLVQSSGKPISGIMTSTMTGQPVKIFKSPTSNAESSQTYTTGTQVIRTITSPKIVTKTVPIHVNSGSIPKGTKTIRLTPTQMQNFKFLNATNQKIQISPTATYQTTQPSPNVKNIPPPILSRKTQRQQDPLELDYTPETKRGRKSEKVSKGLRHFSMKVCEKVKQKGTTTYNEVADELVTEFTNATSQFAAEYDQKNIRRRVYDALNVLMAMNIISKEKKEIRWIGLPTNSLQECQQLEKEVQKKVRSIKEKEKQLNELILNQIAFKNLAQRNKEAEKMHGVPPQNSFIQLPFIVVNTNKKTVINCSISNDKMEYLFQFSDKFEINDDVEILKSIGMLAGLNTGECLPEDLEKIKGLVPESLWPYVDKLANNSIESSLDELLNTAGSSTMTFNVEDFVEATMDDSSRQSSNYDPLSPSAADYSEEEIDSDISSDTELNG
ncbi:unnamed protein product [Brassicogethes aeneus]|uniref:Transcription factor Dp-1 n=1 Tax=Brassicogethes aeneus TaxID=1431903 RepID=A0A9P0FHP8_BRAAE|nr:unnamed protein product [Brassicogethes aeneus]